MTKLINMSEFSFPGITAGGKDWPAIRTKGVIKIINIMNVFISVHNWSFYIDGVNGTIGICKNILIG